MEGQIRKQRQETIYKQQKMRQQILEVIGWIFLSLVVIAFFILIAFLWNKQANAKDYTRQQKIWQGKIVVPTYTTCRLKTQKVFKDKMACIYVGAQKTYEMEFTDIRIGCPKQYRCVVNKNSKIPNIDDVMKSLRDIAK
jgi:hypothetical protein